MNRIICYLPSVLLAGLIFVLSVVPKPMPELDMSHGLDKIAHGLMYWLLGLLLSTGFLRDGFKSRLVRFWLAWVVVALYGGCIEVVQQCFFPPRTGEWADFLADAIGALAGVATIEFLWNKRRIQ